ncbi:phosphatase PAP2 family protein [Bradyrhizobium sp. NP1]|uniref:acid phosphatase n=1 Tax=Bradyrhizobium sp. NP1 TaxID=3049772 RepID=UPI0025A54E81|nr:phosphatase PAP2 family protein [Bradyrhizobium sp. NP1]WJR77448.1 phosphatase PAP2 family protein [Bradyrhizobium sp. NP1]
MLLLPICGQALAQSSEAKPNVTDPHFKIAPGYLKPAELPNSLVLLGPPPERGSAALAKDEEARKATIPLRGTERWKLAITDADLAFPQAADNFSCAMGIKINETQTPRLYAMMQKVLSDFGLSTYGVKNKYNRIRPFVVHDEATCRTDQEAILRGDGSYPSGHTAAGWGWALVFSQINPERSNELFRRGLAFGQSRVICNAHWQSDVDAGRIMGAATVARLQTDPAFLADLKAAEAEVSAAKATPSASMTDCAAEAAALSQQ